MNHYSDTSKKRLETCHKDLRLIFAHVIIDFDNTIVCGSRDETDQNKAFKEGKSKLKFPHSKHNKLPSLAVDAAPYIAGKINWKRENLIFFAGYVLATADHLFRIGVVSHRIRVLADSDKDKDVTDETFRDECHFEIIPNEFDI